MKKKEFEMKVRKIRSSKTNEEFKIRKLNRTYIEYLRSQYSDDAIKFVKRFVLDKYTQENPPIQLHGVFLESAKHYIKNGMYSEASSILEKISDTRNMSILKEVELQKNIIIIRIVRIIITKNHHLENIFLYLSWFILLLPPSLYKKL